MRGYLRSITSMTPRKMDMTIEDADELPVDELDKGFFSGVTLEEMDELQKMD
jgi:hypothetical protein